MRAACIGICGRASRPDQTRPYVLATTKRRRALTEIMKGRGRTMSAAHELAVRNIARLIEAHGVEKHVGWWPALTIFSYETLN
ncbi:hypothetical protein GOP47_0012215 [Adiantum capillus-veneris]|uniref:Uncharacterized protein n=1 Tax=Adiantum capillus-veneris TaxID=13818 RepID=A0A9D4UQ96_ADICA|nr:hypothetical protein GOP47_0012215 [Adiantum capillus-veneris]